MRVIAFRVSLLALAVASSGAWLEAAPLVWLSIALSLVAIAAGLAALLGVAP